MITILTKLLQNRAISSSYHYQNFELYLVSNNPIRGLPSTITLHLGSDWILNDNTWWAEFIDKFPIDTSQMAFPYEPVKAFALFLLNGEITNVHLNVDNSLDLTFSNNYKLHIPSTISYSDNSWMNEPEFDASWRIDVPDNETDFIDFKITCNGQAKVTIEGIESILR